MDPGWDHTENEDKLLLSHASGMGKVTVTNDDLSINSVANSGCNDNYDVNVVDTRLDYNKHLSSVVLNNVNRMHIFLYNLIPTNLSYFCTIVSNIRNSIFKSLKLLASTNDSLCLNDSGTTSNNYVISEFKNFLENNTPKLKDLHTKLLSLSDSYGYIHQLKKHLETVIDCNNGKYILDNKIVEIIKKLNFCIIQFDKIECLVISARSIMYEVKEAKNQLMVSTNAIPSEGLKTDYFKIKTCSNNIDRIYSAICDVEIYSWCLKYWIYKFINVSNGNQNSLSSLDIRYINYFYHVFPLHLNTFNRLFSNVINPKLSNLKPTINQLIHSHTLLSEPIISLHNYSQTLKIDFDSLSNILPSESTYKPFIESVKSYLYIIISKFEISRFSYSFYQIINFIIKTFNTNLENELSKIKLKLDGHIKEIESNINIIIGSLNGSIKIINDQLYMNNKIETFISNLQSNYNSISKFDKYKSRYEIAKTGIGHSTPYLILFRDIYGKLDDYKTRLKQNYNNLKSKLNEWKNILTRIKNTIDETCSLIKNGDNKPIETRKISLQIYILQYFKIFCLNKLNDYIPYFTILEKIGTSIAFLKSNKNKVHDKLDRDFFSAVESLCDIDIRTRQIHTLIITMKTQFDYIIPELQLIKLLLQYRDSIKIMLIPIKSLTFRNYNVSEFIKNSYTIIKILGDIPKTVEHSIHEFNVIFNKIKTKDSYSKYHPEHLTSPFRIDISPIKSSISASLSDIKLMRYIIYNLEIIKSNSLIIDNIKTKISKINDIDSGLTNLEQIYSDITRFYYIQFKSTFLLNFYSGLIGSKKFTESLRRLNEIISQTKKIIYLIPLYYTILYAINVIVKNMEKLKPKVIDLNNFNNNIRHIKSLVSNIIEMLKVFKSNIYEFETNMSGIKANNLRKKMMNSKYQIPVIKENIESFINSIQETISYIDKTIKELKEKSKEIIKEIQKSIDFLSTIIGLQQTMSIPIYVIKEKYKNPIIIVLLPVREYLNEIIKKIEKLIKLINSIINSISLNLYFTKISVNHTLKLIDKIDKGVVDVECAIEGVGRNLIRCSLQSCIKNRTFRVINVSKDNKTFYNPN